MGNKVDISEVVELSHDLKSTVAALTSSLDGLKAEINEVITMDSFSGKAAKQAKDYFGDLHITVSQAFNQLFTDLSDHLKQHLDRFHSDVDPNHSTIIESDYLQDTMRDIDNHYVRLYDEHQRIAKTIHSVADISAATVPSLSSVTNHENKATKTIFDLEDKFNAFTNEGKRHHSKTKDLLHNIESTLNKAGKKTGEARFTDYTAVTAYVGLPVLKDYVNGSTEERDKIKKLDPDSKKIIKKAEEDYKNGLIDKNTFDSILSGVITSGSAYINKVIQTMVTEETSRRVVDSVVNWIKNNSTFFVDNGLVAEGIYGRPVTYTEPPTIIVKTIRGAARIGTKFGGSFIGLAIDFGAQINSGEDLTEATIKTGAHVGAGLIGAEIGGLIGSVVPIGGTFVGIVVGYAIGVAVSVGFDWLYDNSEKILDKMKNAGEEIGNAVSGFFKGLGSVFG